jgi:hypothetical protein
MQKFKTTQSLATKMLFRWHSSIPLSFRGLLLMILSLRYANAEFFASKATALLCRFSFKESRSAACLQKLR